MAGARVEMWRLPAGRVVNIATTDSGGGFRLAAPTGPHRVQVTAERLRDGGLLIEVPRRGEVSCEVPLEAGHALTGRVIDIAGRPLGGIEVWASVHSPAPGVVGEHEEATSGPDGTFHIEGLPDRVALIGARDPGRSYLDSYLTATEPARLAISPEDFSRSGLSEWIDRSWLAPAGTTGLVLVMEEAGRVAVRVTTDTGRAIPKARVWVRSWVWPEMAGLSFREPETTDATGRAVVAELREGQHQLVVSAPGHRTWRGRGIRVQRGRTVHLIVHLVR